MGRVKRQQPAAAAAIVLLVIAYACRLLSLNDVLPRVCGYTRALLHCGLLIAWGVSIQKRIVQDRVRKLLIAVSALLLFWLATRSYKYLLAKDADALRRYLWYLYYLPLSLALLLGSFAALCMRKPEGYRLPKALRLLYLPALAAVGIVLTNDIHQLVFRFPNGIPNDGGSYTYGPLYFAVMVWLSIEILLFFVLLFRACRLPGRGKRLLLPLLPPALCLAYCIAYILEIPIVRVIAGDFSAVCCLAIVSTLEACIHVGLIPSNTHYLELFRATTIAVQIMDNNDTVYLTSDASVSLDKETLRRAKQAPLLNDNMRLSAAAITGGYVFWEEDLTQLTDVLSKLNDAKEGLQESNALLREEYALKVREARIAEQDRLYTILHRDTAPQIALLSQLTEEFEQTAQEDRRKKLLGKMIVIGAYLKRRSNLIFIAAHSPRLEVQELALTFGESMDNLGLYGAACGLSLKLRNPLPAADGMRLYDFFEAVVERALDGLSALALILAEEEDTVTMVLSVDADADFSDLAAHTVTVLRDEDGAWQITMRVGGEAPCAG